MFTIWDKSNKVFAIAAIQQFGGGTTILFYVQYYYHSFPTIAIIHWGMESRVMTECHDAPHYHTVMLCTMLSPVTFTHV